VLSWILILAVLPFFIAWSVYGSILFVRINTGYESCEVKSETYPFIIFWLIMSFVLIFCYGCLLLYGVSAAERANSVRKSIL
jgi:hypothetical protein